MILTLCTGGFKWILGAVAMLAIVTLGLLALSIFPAFTTDIGRAINVRINMKKNWISYVVEMDLAVPLHFWSHLSYGYFNSVLDAMFVHIDSSFSGRLSCCIMIYIYRILSVY